MEKELGAQVMEMSEKKLGADRPSTLIVMNQLASTVWNQGRWEAAKELEVQVMETRKKKNHIQMSHFRSKITGSDSRPSS
jgi:ribosomal protein L31E